MHISASTLPRATLISEPMAASPTRARFIEPMLLLRTDRLAEGRNRQYEVKLDGYRAIAFKTGGKVHLRYPGDNWLSVLALRTRAPKPSTFSIASISPPIATLNISNFGQITADSGPSGG
jgi:hypothetical protein